MVDPTDESLETMITACKACTDAGLVTVCAFPAYTPGDRERLRHHIGEDRVVQVFVDTDLELECWPTEVSHWDWNGYDPEHFCLTC